MKKINKTSNNTITSISSFGQWCREFLVKHCAAGTKLWKTWLVWNISYNISLVYIIWRIFNLEIFPKIFLCDISYILKYFLWLFFFYLEMFLLKYLCNIFSILKYFPKYISVAFPSFGNIFWNISLWYIFPPSWNICLKYFCETFPSS